MHGRCHATIDLHLPALPSGSRQVFTDQAGIPRTKRDAKREAYVEGEPHRSLSYILLRAACEADSHMDDSFNELI